MKDDGLYLHHMKECLDRIESYLGEGRDLFDRDQKTRDAVLRNLQTLAQSAMRLSEARRAASAQIDWKGISAFRNVIVHDYLGVDPDEVWKIIEEDLPPLRDFLARELDEFS